MYRNKFSKLLKKIDELEKIIINLDRTKKIKCFKCYRIRPINHYHRNMKEANKPICIVCSSRIRRDKYYNN